MKTTRSLRGWARATAAIAGVAVLSLSAIGTANAQSRAQTANLKSAGLTAVPSLEALLPSSVRSAGVLTIGTDAEYPPCEYFAKNGQMVGFEPDLWNDVAALLGLKVKAQSIAFDGLLPGVESSRFDVAIECIGDTTAREAHFGFVDFIFDQSVIVTLAADPDHITTNPLSVCGLTAAVQTGTTYTTYISQRFDPYCKQHGKAGVTPLSVPAQGQALLDMQSGRAAFAMVDAAAGAYLTQTTKVKLKLVPDTLLPKDYIGVVTKKGSSSFQHALLGAFRRLVSDGRYEKILQKWDMWDFRLTNPGIDLATARPLHTPPA